MAAGGCGVCDDTATAGGLPDWTAEAATLRAAAAILAVCVNDSARTGDVSQWTLGEQLIRTPWGSWHLDWEQEKTGNRKLAGELWPEIGRVIDEHILGGRPGRHAHRRYEELRGCNWLSLTPQPYERRWPSERVSDAIGVPLHDLRTLCSDYLRQHDPVAAPKIVSVVLGHRTQEAGKEYDSQCGETASQREWQTARIAAPFKPSVNYASQYETEYARSRRSTTAIKPTRPKARIADRMSDVSTPTASGVFRRSA